MLNHAGCTYLSILYAVSVKQIRIFQLLFEVVYWFIETTLINTFGKEHILPISFSVIIVMINKVAFIHLYIPFYHLKESKLKDYFGLSARFLNKADIWKWKPGIYFLMFH